jgi:hypothetical protein
MGGPTAVAAAPAEPGGVVANSRSQPDGEGIRVEDPGAFNMPWSARQTYHRTRTGGMEEAICAENNIAFDSSVTEIPKADKGGLLSLKRRTSRPALARYRTLAQKLVIFG